MENVKLLDDYSVSVNLKTGKRTLKIPFLDMNDAFISDDIVENNLFLPVGFGVLPTFYVPPASPNEKDSCGCAISSRFR